MTNQVINVEGLTKVFRSKNSFLKKTRASYTAVNDVSFSLKEGEILGILGPNGAGKTTTIQMLLGTLTPTSGKISYFGKIFNKDSNDLLQYVTHASAYNKLPGFLTVEESLEVFARIYGLNKKQRKERIEELVDFFGIEKLINKRCQTLSAGQMTRLVLVKAFISRPKIVLLDEPTASLDPDIALETRNFILEQQKKFNVSMIVTSHNMQEVSEICNRVLVLKEGVIIEEDTPQKLARSVSLTKLSLTFSEKIIEAKKILSRFSSKILHTDSVLSAEVDETEIAKIFIALAQHEIIYTHVEIVKPTLEDYFLYISKNNVREN